jgi:hypothetical protein
MADLSKKEIEELKNLINLLDKNIKGVSFDNLVKSADAARAVLKDLRLEAREFTDDISTASQSWKEIVNQISKTRTTTKDTANLFNQLYNISNKILYDQKDISNLSQKDVKLLKQKVGQTKALFEINKNVLEQEKSSLDAQKLAQERLIKNYQRYSYITGNDKLLKSSTEELNKINKKIKENLLAQENIFNVLNKENTEYAATIASLDRINNRIEQENNLLGLTGGAASGLNDIFSKFGLDGLSNALGLNTALEATQDKVKTIVKAKEEEERLAFELKQLDEEKAKRQQNEKDLEAQILEEIKKKNEERVAQGKLPLTGGQLNTNLIGKAALAKKKELEFTKEQNAEADKLNEKEKERLKTLKNAAAAVGNSGSKFSVMLDYVKNLGTNLKKNLTDPLFVAGLAFKYILNGFLSLDKAQAEFARQTGHTVDHFDTLNNSLLSSADYIEAAGALTKQLGMDATSIFTEDTIKEAAELHVLMGLSADEASKLAIFSKLNGKELKLSNENVIKQISNFNKVNRTALSGQAIFQDIAQTTDIIAVNLGGDASKIAAANLEARKLGLSLGDVDRIAASLLEFESSISAELEAELLTGKELNLEKARLLALNNDLEGLAKEIGNNEAITSAFASKNRIQQEALAKSIGLQREDLAKMVIAEKQRAGLTDEEVAKAAGMTLEDYKRLSVQESINKSIAKMGEALAVPLEIVANLLNSFGLMKILIAGIGTIMTVQLVKGMADFGRLLVMAIPRLGVMLGLESGIAAAKLTGLAAATLGVGTLIAIGAAAAAISAMTSSVNSAKGTGIGDGFFPSSGKTQISTKEGVFNPSPNDDILVRPNIGGMMKNTSTVKSNNSNYSLMVAESKAQTAILKDMVNTLRSERTTVVQVGGDAFAKQTLRAIGNNTTETFDRLAVGTSYT